MEAFHRQERLDGAGGAGYWLRLAADHVQAAMAVRRAKVDGETKMRQLLEDLVAGARTLRRAPAFTTFAVMTLALGIGATAAVFTVLDRVVLRPLPYPGSERMVRLGTDLRHNPGSPGPLSPALVVALQSAPGPAEGVVGASSTGAILSMGGDPERFDATRVTPGFFPFFGARARVGRLLTQADHAAGAERVAVLGHGFWRERYGGDPEVVGHTLHLDDEEYAVVGVLSADFIPPPGIVEHDDVWISMRLAEGEPETGMFSVAGVARLRPGATLDEYASHASRVAADVYPDGDRPNFVLGAVALDYRHTVVGDAGGTLGRVLGAVGLLLVIACVNVASLQLTRGTQRAHELAVRTALGAGRGRLLRQLLSENVVLALVGGAIGSGIAFSAVRLFRRYAPGDLPRLAELGVDGRGLAFSLALAVATVLLFGLLPALRSTGTQTGAVGIGTPNRVGSGRREGRLRGTLVAVETALAVLLAVGSTLLARDLVRMSTEDPGFRPAGVVSMRLDLAPRYERAEWVALWERLLETARALPGADAAAVATQVPYTGDRIASMYRPEGTGPESVEGTFIVTVVVGGDYLAALGTSLAEGRWFDAGDDASSATAVVNEAFVRRFWPGETGVGKHVRSGAAGIEDEPNYRVVGVVADMTTRPGREADARIYLPLRSEPWRAMEVVVRADGDAVGLGPALREVVRRLDPALPVTSIRTVESLGREALTRPRFYTTLFGSFALVALVLAIVGVYGTTAYATRSRTRDIGIRLALGAQRLVVVRGVVLGTGGVVAAGVALGLGMSALAARGMGNFLHRVTPGDVPSYAAVGALVLLAGIVAALVPAARAGSVDPASTLREE
jgi:predicted permease